MRARGYVGFALRLRHQYAHRDQDHTERSYAMCGHWTRVDQILRSAERLQCAWPAVMVSVREYYDVRYPGKLAAHVISACAVRPKVGLFD